MADQQMQENTAAQSLPHVNHGKAWVNLSVFRQGPPRNYYEIILSGNNKTNSSDPFIAEDWFQHAAQHPRNFILRIQFENQLMEKRERP